MQGSEDSNGGEAPSKSEPDDVVNSASSIPKPGRINSQSRRQSSGLDPTPRVQSRLRMSVRKESRPSNLPPQRLSTLSERGQVLEDEGNLHVGSLDFERVINEYSIQASLEQVADSRQGQDTAPLLKDGGNAYNTFNQRDRKKNQRHEPQTGVMGYTGRNSTRWFLSCTTGLLTGLTAILICRSTDSIVKFRAKCLDELSVRLNPILLFVLYTSANLCLALLSTYLCLRWAPEAVGSGIPEVKAYLNGVRVKKFTSFQLFFVKVLATILSVSSGLILGPEGPLVHTGAIFGAALTKLGPALQSRGLCTSGVAADLSNFCTDGERRDLVNIGAACGFASAFGAPIGGLLFSLEELMSFYAHAMLWKTLTATAIATFCIAWMRGDLSVYSVINLGQFDTPDYDLFFTRFEELPFYVSVGVMGGLLGGMLCLTWKRIQFFRKGFLRRFAKSERNFFMFFEVAFVSVMTSSLLFGLPFLSSWDCQDAFSDGLDIQDMDIDNTFNCPPRQINLLASILFGSREESIKHLLTDPSQYDPRTLLAVGCVFFPLMILTLGVALPSGIFMPTILIGTSLGGYVGLMLNRHFNDEVSPSTFALLGAAALLAGIQRSTVCLCVILVEGTGQVKVLIPVIVTVVFARYVGDMISRGGIYDVVMEVSQYPYLEHHAKKNLDASVVSDIMSLPHPSTTFLPVEKAGDIEKKLRSCEHHGFPVVDQNKKFLGLVRRDQLVALLECGIFLDDESAQDSTLPSRPTAGGKQEPTQGLSRLHVMNIAKNMKDNQSPGSSYNDISDYDDEFDQNAWFVATMRSTRNVFQEVQDTGVDDGLPALPPPTLSRTRVGVSKSGSLVVSLDHGVTNKNVNIGAVMNRGTYCCTDTLPVSKAYEMFTSLGLRHLVVLGGSHGGEVVGIVTRSNFLTLLSEDMATSSEPSN